MPWLSFEKDVLPRSESTACIPLYPELATFKPPTTAAMLSLLYKPADARKRLLVCVVKFVYFDPVDIHGLKPTRVELSKPAAQYDDTY